MMKYFYRTPMMKKCSPRLDCTPPRPSATPPLIGAESSSPSLSGTEPHLVAPLKPTRSPLRGGEFCIPTPLPFLEGEKTYGRTYFRSTIKRKTSFSFTFRSLIRTFDYRRRYSRSEILKYIWYFARLFVPLRRKKRETAFARQFKQFDCPRLIAALRRKKRETAFARQFKQD